MTTNNAFGQIVISAESNFNAVADSLIASWFNKNQRLELDYTSERQIHYVIGVNLERLQVINSNEHTWHFAMDKVLPLEDDYVRKIRCNTWQNWLILDGTQMHMMIPWRVENDRIIGQLVGADLVSRPIYIQPSKK